MEYVNLPEGYQTVMPYLILKNAPGFIKFTREVFNAEEIQIIMREDEVIMHGEISIGGSVIMFAEQSEDFGVQNAGLFVYLDNCDKTYEVALANGAFSIMEPADQNYGRSAGIKDPFGNIWWLTTAII
ncbi:VOC family protein [Pedobacter immunditicola]|uniref:VOC family protein n=1 Tax=Pedobacter immunditicola TaxID=3133440 RepID=UPI0030B26211